MNEFLKLLFFNHNTIFFHKIDFSYRKKKLLDTVKLFIKSKNKYQFFFNLRELFFEIISYAYIPPAVILYFLNYKFICTYPHSIGTYSEELEAILLRNKRKRKKLILLEPDSYSSNKYWVDMIYQNQLIKITSNFISIILTPFTYISFIAIDAYYPYDKVYFQKQFYHSNNQEKEKSNFDHEILFKARYVAARSNIFKYRELENQHNYYLKKNEIKKICFLHIRFETNYVLRNSNFDKYLPSIKYLIKNDYKVFFFSKFNPKLNLNGFQYFDLNIEENKKKQIYYLINSEIYFGQISGLFSLANFLDKKLIITDLVIFNHLLISKNFTVIIKKYIKNGIQMKLNEIFNNNYQCIWDQATLKNLNIQTLDNNDQEILEATKEMIEKKNSHQFEVKEYFEKNKIKFKFMNYSILRGIPKFFLEKII